MHEVISETEYSARLLRPWWCAVCRSWWFRGITCEWSFELVIMANDAQFALALIFLRIVPMAHIRSFFCNLVFRHLNITGWHLSSKSEIKWKQNTERISKNQVYLECVIDLVRSSHLRLASLGKDFILKYHLALQSLQLLQLPIRTRESLQCSNCWNLFCLWH